MGAIDDQRFEFLLNNFARLTNIISEECQPFFLSTSVFRLQLLFTVFKLKAPKDKQLSKFSVFTSFRK